VPTQIWSDFMAKAHEGLTPQNLPDASSAAVPATDLMPADPLASIASDGSQQPLDLTGQPTPAPADGTQPVAADGTQPAVAADGTQAAAPQPLVPDQTQAQPSAQQPAPAAK